MKSRTLGLGLFTALLTLLAPPGALSQEASPSSEGIAVHGHWTITVVRDGGVVERREFENDLTLGGMQLLSMLLTRQRSTGPWVILVEADGTGTLCANNEFVLGTDTDCAISEATGEAFVSRAGANLTTVLLEGTETVVRDANLILVNTYEYSCVNTQAPSDCVPTGVPGQFTRTSLPSPIAVLTGDRIEVTVEISFS